MKKKNDSKSTIDRVKSPKKLVVVGSNNYRPFVPSASASFNDTTKTIVPDEAMSPFATEKGDMLMREIKKDISMSSYATEKSDILMSEFKKDMIKYFEKSLSSENVSVSSSENSTNFESEFPTKNRNAAQLFFDFSR